MKQIYVVLKHWFSECSAHQYHLEGSLLQVAGLHPQISDSVSLGWGLRICLSNEFPGDVAAAAAIPGTAL